MERADLTFDERLERLTDEFHRSLPRRLREIAGTAADAESGVATAMRELRLLLHRPAGSAATDGLRER